MTKITVTREQQKAVKEQKETFLNDINCIIHLKENCDHLQNGMQHLYDMSVEQIVLAWHGYAEVEPELVAPWEAYRLIFEGKQIRGIDNMNEKEFFMKGDDYNADYEWFDPYEIKERGIKFYILEDES